MKYRFVLGVGRSGTTFLSRLMALSNSPMKYIVEPLPRVKRLLDTEYTEPWTVLPLPDSPEVINARNIILGLSSRSNELIREDVLDRTVVRDDPYFEFMLIKEVHGLLAFPLILSGVDYKAVVIVRRVERVLDSYFHGHTKQQRKYLIDEYDYIKNYLSYRHGGFPKNKILDLALKEVSKGIRNYIKRSRLFTKEILRHACIVETLNQFLEQWSVIDNRVKLVSFEDLCVSPVDESKCLYNFLDFEYGNSTIDKIINMTTGDKSSYYETDKNSEEILKQDFKFLKLKNRNKINGLIS